MICYDIIGTLDNLLMLSQTCKSVKFGELLKSRRSYLIDVEYVYFSLGTSEHLDLLWSESSDVVHKLKYTYSTAIKLECRDFRPKSIFQYKEFLIS